MMRWRASWTRSRAPLFGVSLLRLWPSLRLEGLRGMALDGRRDGPEQVRRCQRRFTFRNHVGAWRAIVAVQVRQFAR